MSRSTLIIVVGVAVVLSASLLGLVRLSMEETAAGSIDPDDRSQVAMGSDVYARACASCHGADLEGQPNWQSRGPDGTYPAPPHDATGHTWHHADPLLFDYTKRGGAEVIGGGFASGMPGFGERLTDDEIRAVIAYIKSTWPPHIRQRQEERSSD